MSVLTYFDVALVVIATPVMLLLGVPAAAYCITAGAWVLLRLLGIGVERYATATADANRQIAIRMGYMFLRLFGLAMIVILLRNADGKNAGITALIVAVVAFTIHLFTAPLGRAKGLRAARAAATSTPPRSR